MNGAELLEELHRLRDRYQAAVAEPRLLTEFIDGAEQVKRDPALEELPVERRVALRNTLAQAWRWRFKEYGNPDDLRRAITLWQEALELSTGVREYQASFHNSLAFGFNELFGVTGDRAYFSHALHHTGIAVELTAPDSADRAVHIMTSALRLVRQYDLTGDLASLDRAVGSLEITLGQTENSTNQAKIEHNLSVALAKRFLRTGDPLDAGRARALVEQALARTDPRDREYADTLNSVALRKGEQASALGDVALLDEAIAHFRVVLDLFPATAPMRTATLHNLANALSDRFHLTGDLGNLDDSIRLLQEVLAATATVSPHWAKRSASLGQRYLERYLRLGQPADWTASTAAFAAACSGAVGSDPQARLQSGRSWGDAALGKGESAVAATAFGHAVAALDELWRAQVSERYRDVWLAQASGLHAQSAYAAVSEGDERGAAADLERGRAFALSQQLELDRIQIDLLAGQGRADLARRLTLARDRLYLLSN